MGTILLLLAVPIAICAAFIYLVRLHSEKARKKMTEGDRKLSLTAYLILGVLIPLPVCFVLYHWVSQNKALFSSEGLAIPLLGTLASMTGLPFIIKGLRLIHSDSKALWTAVFLGPYGFLLWFITLAFLSML